MRLNYNRLMESHESIRKSINKRKGTELCHLIIKIYNKRTHKKHKYLTGIKLMN